MSGEGGSPRFEVIASTRRRWSAEQKRAILGLLDSGVSVSEVARRYGLHTSLLFRWRRLATESAASPAPTRAPAFVPAVIASSSTRGPEPRCTSPCLVEITLGNGRIVRVGSDVDAAALARIVAALDDKR